MKGVIKAKRMVMLNNKLPQDWQWVRLCEIMGIEVLDYVIVSAKGYLSMKNRI